jgi:lipoprotein NlpI
MTHRQKATTVQYTCREYREEMIVLALRQKLRRPDLSDEERAKLQKEIGRLEEAMGL